MKFSLRRMLSKKIISVITVIWLLIAVLFSVPLSVSALSFPEFNPKSDIDYSGKDGRQVVLNHKRENSSVTESYYLDDSLMSRNATIYLSVKGKFTNAESFGISFRNVTAEFDGKEISGDLVLRMFKASAISQIGNVSVGQEKWASFSNIQDGEWHEITVRCDTESIALWIDGKQAKGTYFSSKLKSMTSNYARVGVFIGGYNEGTLKDVRIWNNGLDENPVMPADKVIKSISKLPSVLNVTKSDSKNIKKVIADYNALSDKEKKYVTNYPLLEQLNLALVALDKSYVMDVSGAETGRFSEVFGNNVISHSKTDLAAKYYFESGLSRNSTYYIQFAHNFDFVYSYDLYLRRAEYKVDGKKLSGVIGIRFFQKSAAIVDEKQNRISSFINYGDISKGTHIVTVKSSVSGCTVWIDGKKYEFKCFLKNDGSDPNDKFNSVTNVDFISATPGFYFGSNPEYGAFGKVFNIKVFNDKNTLKENKYSVGDEARISIFNLPSLNKVTLKDKSAIGKARSYVDKLSKEDLKYVTNIAKLEKLERAIDFIETDGDYAFNFLHDDMPVIKSDDVNLISSATFNVAADYMNDVTYNSVSHELSCKNKDEYINVDFKSMKNLSANDTYVIKYTYTPHEYYYENATSNWMGLRTFFSGYEVGGNGQKSTNKTQFAIMVEDLGIISTVNGTTGTTDYYGGYKIELNKSYDVVMLCKSGKMKVWINNRPVAYYDNLPEFTPYFAFQFSRCNCDVKNIQVYNYNDVLPTVSKNSEENTLKFVPDTLYDAKGKEIVSVILHKRYILVAAALLSAFLISVLIMFFIRIKKKR